MASILAPPPSTAPHDSHAPDGNVPDFPISPEERGNAMEVEGPPKRDNAMQVEDSPPGDTPQPPPELTNSTGEDNMQVDEHGTNETIPTEPVLRRTPRNIKPIDHASKMQQLLPAPPSRKSNGKKQKKTVKSESLQPRPVIIGSKHMQLSFIDLTEVEVRRISLLCSGAFHSCCPRSAHLIPWSSPAFP